ncbi:MAG TPA: hypothetical protein VGM25_00525 [Caulobacteraceae bacterium]|jgi:hypothetical protein
MARLMDINARHGDESQAAHRSNRPIWIWVLIAAVIMIAIIAALSRAATGPGANTGRVASETSHVEAGVAPGVGSTYSGQPGGRTDGTPAPNPNAPKEDATR